MREARHRPAAGSAIRGSSVERGCSPDSALEMLALRRAGFALNDVERAHLIAWTRHCAALREVVFVSGAW